MTEQEAARRELVDVFARREHELKRSGFIQANRPDAQADWAAYAQFLGEQFFAEVKRRGVAETLINRPPARLMNDLAWRSQNGPLDDVEKLFAQGVKRVRNSLVHGEKFVGDQIQRERDLTLVQEAIAILKLAEEWGRLQK